MKLSELTEGWWDKLTGKHQAQQRANQNFRSVMPNLTTSVPIKPQSAAEIIADYQAKQEAKKRSKNQYTDFEGNPISAENGDAHKIALELQKVTGMLYRMQDGISDPEVERYLVHLVMSTMKVQKALIARKKP